MHFGFENVNNFNILNQRHERSAHLLTEAGHVSNVMEVKDAHITAKVLSEMKLSKEYSVEIHEVVFIMCCVSKR